MKYFNNGGFFFSNYQKAIQIKWKWLKKRKKKKKLSERKKGEKGETKKKQGNRLMYEGFKHEPAPGSKFQELSVAQATHTFFFLREDPPEAF